MICLYENGFHNSLRLLSDNFCINELFFPSYINNRVENNTTRRRNCNTTRISNSYNQGVSSSFSCISTSSRLIFCSDDEMNTGTNTHHPHMQGNESEQFYANKTSLSSLSKLKSEIHIANHF